MATAATEFIDVIEKYDSLILQIEDSFSQYHSILDTQKDKLLERVRTMKELYRTHCEIAEAIKQMEGIKVATNEMVTKNLVAQNKEQIIGLWDDKISELRVKKVSLDSVSEMKFVRNTDEFAHCVNKIHLGDCLPVEYCKRREPIVMQGRSGAGEGDIGFARAIVVDKEQDCVYVADYFKRCVSVFSLEGKFVRNFGKDNLLSPRGICLSDNFVFVGQKTKKSIVKFTKDGKYLTDTKSINKETDTHCSNLCVHNNQTLYVCNYTGKKIDTFGIDLSYTGSFGNDMISYPDDIKVQNNTLFVLDRNSKNIYTYTTAHVYLACIKLAGYGYIENHQGFFAIDNDSNFIVTSYDYNSNSCLKVYSPSGEYIESLGSGYLTNPRGLDLDRHGRIISLSNSCFNTFQVY